MVVKNLEELRKLREKFSQSTIVLATGSFDLLHFEHLRYLEDAKKLGDILVVAVKSNNAVALKNPTRPIIDEAQRVYCVDALRCVDYVFLADYDETVKVPENFSEKESEWLKIFSGIFSELKPDILYHEENPDLDAARLYAFETYGIRGVSRERTAIVSTSKIIAKILESNAETETKTGTEASIESKTGIGTENGTETES